MKNKTRLLAAAILICAMLFALISCGSDEDKTASEQNESTDQPAAETSAAEKATTEQGTTAAPTTEKEDPIQNIDATSFLKVAETGERNDFTGSLGYEFTCTTDMKVVALGRPVNGKMYDPHTIDIWEVSSKTLVASAEVNPESPRDALGFKFAYLKEPITLKAGEVYRIASSEEAGGDWWYDCGVSGDEEDIPDLQPGDSGAVTRCVFTDAPGEYPSNGWNPGEKSGRGYVGPTFYYVPAA